MRFISDLIKGIFIGVANIIPGVSGGTMAVSLGIYDKILEAVNNLTSSFKQSVQSVLPIGIGAIMGIGVFSFILPYVLLHYPLQTTLCFIGMIAGGLPEIFHHTKSTFQMEKKSVNLFHILVLLTFLAFSIWMAFASPQRQGDQSLNVNLLSILTMLGIGLIAAATMVIPGVSGSLVLMILGYYDKVIGSISGLIKALKGADLQWMLHELMILVPFAIGCIIGIFLISKFITWLFKRHGSYTYFGILGLILASPFAIFLKMEPATLGFANVIVGAILFLLGFLLTWRFSHKNET